MAHQRAQSTSEALKGPHTVSLKVLRLSRPSLATQYPLPDASPSTPLHIPPEAALAYPSTTSSPLDHSTISPLLKLPESFGSAYVGETFSCTLCANNELLASDNTRAVSGVRITADIQTPSKPAGAGLELQGASGEDDADESGSEELAPGQTLQKILRHELREEGNHILAVTVRYTETVLTGGGGEGQGAASGRVRTFRKLYQFVAQPLLSVRTKAGELPGKGRGWARYALEAQLENLGERAVVLETVSVNPRSPFKSTSLNWDASPPGEEVGPSPIINPRDVFQVAFFLEQQGGLAGDDENAAKLRSGDRRLILGQLSIQWRSAMGDRGTLSTGWLTGRQR
ncbi:hypothetical protein W97_01991 [Coniosporium apollinis CBS 100218]|uniref:DUF974 domain-containing protein n=1 Tax=Coniosporium apollinis (strain CBS 100218) TaxID=1168221 RepID=R7YMA0_CONA1|nr:uncharacterized protein W97_01991 [Coniosporium apollinis CBS 100218]EON62766.1 hypothetical protein W97_01991 [Coniosporium apollinis CBS 100218]